MINTPELIAVYQHHVAHPEEHDPTMWGARWACGTTYCTAGRTAVRAGAEPLWDEPLVVGGILQCHLVRTVDDVVRPVDAYAAEILGLDSDEAGALFSCDRSLDEIRGLITQLTGVDPATAAPVVRVRRSGTLGVAYAELRAVNPDRPHVIQVVYWDSRTAAWIAAARVIDQDVLAAHAVRAEGEA